MSFESPLPPYNASDPSATFLNSSCLDLLMIELVPMAYRVVNEVEAGAEGREHVVGKENLESGRTPAVGSGGGGVSNGGVVNGGRKMDEEEERDAVFFRLEMLGYRVGQGLVERYVYISLEPAVSADIWLKAGE
jgi:hypothetical protein